MPSYAAALEYIHGYWPRIIRHQPEDSGTLIGLPRPYLVPGDDSAMFQEMYYWDSFFIALGVVGTPHAQLVVDMAENMAHLIERFGLIPNASRFYFLSRSQPPFFTQMVRLAFGVKRARGDADSGAWLERMAGLAAREHDTVWLGTAQPHHRTVHDGLARYFDINFLDVLAACESGWDHSTRCADRWLDHLPADLNSILVQCERDLAWFTHELGHTDEAARWEAAAEARAATIRRLLWDEARGLFFDYDYRNLRQHPDPSLAGFYPLWAGVATQEQAEQIVRRWLPRFLRRGGLLTTLRRRAGRQWAAPNGWAPLQWIVAGGLERYGYAAEAERVMRRWCDGCAEVYGQTGALWEKYNVVTRGGREEEGLYGSVPGFGWSNGVFVDFARRLGDA